MNWFILLYKQYLNFVFQKKSLEQDRKNIWFFHAFHAIATITVTILSLLLLLTPFKTHHDLIYLAYGFLILHACGPIYYIFLTSKAFTIFLFKFFGYATLVTIVYCTSGIYNPVLNFLVIGPLLVSLLGVQQQVLIWTSMSAIIYIYFYFSANPLEIQIQTDMHSNQILLIVANSTWLIFNFSMALLFIYFKENFRNALDRKKNELMNLMRLISHDLHNPLYKMQIIEGQIHDSLNDQTTICKLSVDRLKMQEAMAQANLLQRLRDNLSEINLEKVTLNSLVECLKALSFKLDFQLVEYQHQNTLVNDQILFDLNLNYFELAFENLMKYHLSHTPSQKLKMVLEIKDQNIIIKCQRFSRPLRQDKKLEDRKQKNLDTSIELDLFFAILEKMPITIASIDINISNDIVLMIKHLRH